MTAYKVTFRWYDTDTYCTNLVYSKDYDKVAKEYNKHEIISITEADESFVRMAKLKGMPIKTIF